MAVLDLNVSPRTSVFRQIEKTLKNDPTLKRVIRTWRTWEGKTTDLEPLPAQAGGPSVRLTPVSGDEAFVFADAMKGKLTVGVECAIGGTCADDPLNLWFAIERALYPANETARTAIRQALVAAGASNGAIVTFSAPNLAQDEGNVNWLVSGTIKIDVLLNINT